MALNTLQKATVDGLSDEEKLKKINVVLQKMDEILDLDKENREERFRRSRHEFLKTYGTLYEPNTDPERLRWLMLDFSFSLSSEDIISKTMRKIMHYEGDVHPKDTEHLIDKKMGRGIIGCTGTAKLFCTLAKQEGLDCKVVMTAGRNNWEKVRNQAQKGVAPAERDIINGHQIIAVEFSDDLHAFDPGYKEKGATKFLDIGKIEVGNFLDMPNIKDHFVTAIISPEEYAKVNLYQNIANLYSSGKIDDSSFTVSPKQPNKIRYQKSTYIKR